jgi:hypothetical protein
LVRRVGEMARMRTLEVGGEGGELWDERLWVGEEEYEVRNLCF